MQNKKTEHNYIRILRESLEKKTVILDRIIELNSEQTKIATEKEFNVEAFDDIYAEKDRLINELDDLDRGFSNVYERVKEEMKDNREAYRDEISLMQKLIKEITDKSVNIQVEERRNRDLMMQRTDKIKKEVKMAKMSNQVTAAYFQNMNKTNVVEPQFMDKKK